MQSRSQQSAPGFHPQQQQQRSDITEAVERVCKACGLQPTTEAEVAEMTVSEVRVLATSPSIRWQPQPTFHRVFSHPIVPDMQVFHYKSPSSLPS